MANFPRTHSGIPDHDYAGSGSAYNPIIFAMELLIEFYQRTLLTEITSRDYEGEIKHHGSEVVIRELPDIDIHDYAKGQKITRQKPQPAKQSMYIDKGKYYAFDVDDVDVAQSDIDQIKEWAVHASKKMKRKVERDFFEDIYSQVDTLNTGPDSGAIMQDIDLGTPGAPVVLTKANIMDFLLDCSRVLEEQDVPEDEPKKMVLPSWATQMIKGSEIKDASLSGDGKSTLRTGRIGMVDGWEIFQSNLLHMVTDGTDTVCNAFFNVPMSTQFAAQVDKDEIVQNQDTFGKHKRGLTIYGYKVTKPQGAGHAYIAKG